MTNNLSPYQRQLVESETKRPKEKMLTIHVDRNDDGLAVVIERGHAERLLCRATNLPLPMIIELIERHLMNEFVSS